MQSHLSGHMTYNYVGLTSKRQCLNDVDTTSFWPYAYSDRWYSKDLARPCLIDQLDYFRRKSDKEVWYALRAVCDGAALAYNTVINGLLMLLLIEFLFNLNTAWTYSYQLSWLFWI